MVFGKGDIEMTKFRVINDEIEYDGHSVATFRPGVLPSVKENARRELEDGQEVDEDGLREVIEMTIGEIIEMTIGEFSDKIASAARDTVIRYLER